MMDRRDQNAMRRQDTRQDNLPPVIHPVVCLGPRPSTSSLREMPKGARHYSKIKGPAGALSLRCHGSVIVLQGKLQIQPNIPSEYHLNPFVSGSLNGGCPSEQTIPISDPHDLCPTTVSLKSLITNCTSGTRHISPPSSCPTRLTLRVWAHGS